MLWPIDIWGEGGGDKTNIFPMKLPKIWNSYCLIFYLLTNCSGDIVRDEAWDNLFPVQVLPDGMVIWAPAGEFTSSCELIMSDFPFDSQTCHLDFGNLIHDETFVNVTSLDRNVNLDFYIENKEFDLTGNSASHVTFNLMINEAETMTLPATRFTLVLKRKPVYYILNIFIPSTVLSGLSLIVFIVPIDAGEKMALGITILLSFSVYMLILSDNTPQTSDHIPVLSK